MNLMTLIPSSPLAGAVVVFDLDGTLVDTAPDLVGALNAVLAECGLAPHPVEAARHLVGHGARVLIAHGFQAAGADLDDARVGDLVERFLAAYEARIADASRLFPNALAMLDTLDAQGARSVVCTNKPGDLARTLLRALGVLERFAVVVGPDDAGFAKPDRRHLLAALERAGAGSSPPCVMVGDSAADVGAARNAGVPVIVTRFGYTPVAPEDLGGDVLIDDLAEVPKAVLRLLAAALPAPDGQDIAPPSETADA